MSVIGAHALLEELLGEIRAVLDEQLIGFYGYGSLFAGDFDEAVSDVDTLAVLSADVADEQMEALRRMHARLSSRHVAWADRVEVQYVSQHALSSFRSGTHNMAVISPGETLHMVPCTADWLVNWYFVQDYGARLYGPPASELLSPIQQSEFWAAIRSHALQWPEYVKQARKLRAYQGYAVLTMCRALYTVQFGEQVSKQRAAAWVCEQCPEHADLVTRALQWRQGENLDGDPETSYAEVESFVLKVSSRIARI